MAPQPETELGELAAADPSTSPVEASAQPHAVERSRSAYLVLLGCVLIQAPIWGYSLSFGIFEEYYTTGAGAGQLLSSENGGAASVGAVASVGTSQTGVLYLMMPASLTVLTRYPALRPWCGPAGLILTTACLIASSFASTARQLIAVQGVLHAIGCGLLFSAASLCLDEWFAERKGLAYGAMWSGKSGSGAGLPFLTNALLNKYGSHTTLRIFAVASAILATPPLFLMRPRPPPTTATTSQAAEHEGRTGGRGRVSFSFARHSAFWILQCGNVLQSMGYLMPSTYLASYARALGFPSATGPVFLALISLASVPGSLLIGLLSDARGLLAPTTVILVSSLGSALPVFLLWGLGGRHVGVLVVFSLLYGFFAGGFSSTWSAVLHEMRRRDAATDTGLIFGMLLGGRGLGFVISGPVGGALVEAGRLKAAAFTGYATQYGPMMIYTGLTATLGAWGWFWTMGKRAIRAF
ncbi:MFS general substrate transporter [Hypoxylon sp. FL1284]|nr:MFS general substrate transporter [Hypoxylon sp. FL1284]